MNFTLEQSLGLISSAAAAWLMVRAGVAKHQFVIRGRGRCGQVVGDSRRAHARVSRRRASRKLITP